MTDGVNGESPEFVFNHKKETCLILLHSIY